VLHDESKSAFVPGAESVRRQGLRSRVDDRLPRNGIGDYRGEDAEASLTAGVGAKAGLEFQASVFSGSSLKIEAGVTVGLGAETSSKFTVNPSAVGPAFQSVFYASYLELSGERKKAYAYVTYFREIEGNIRLFEKAREVIEKEMAGVIAERNRLFTEFAAWKQLEGLASFRATGKV
jgi:hypothetical protein